MMSEAIRLVIEDYLQSKNVFLNGLNDKPAHMDSYMTVIDYENLKKALEESKFTKEQWESCIPEWEHYGYLSPMSALLGKIIKRYLETGTV